MSGTRTAYRSDEELVAAFLEQPLPKDLYSLSQFEKVDPPWGPPPHGSGPTEYASAWSEGYDGGPIRGAFRWLGQFGLDACLALLPKSLRSRGRPPRTEPIEDFEAIPEIGRVAEYVLENGAAMHDIQELLFGLQDIWTDLDRTRPDTWSVEEFIEILSARNARGKSSAPVPAAFLFLWASSAEPYHAKQIEKAQRLLHHALCEVMPGRHR